MSLTQYIGAYSFISRRARSPIDKEETPTAYFDVRRGVSDAVYECL